MSDLTPGSPEWCRRVSSSKAAAILGISPWDSQRSMWHKMRGEIPWDAETPAMERGTLCEPAVLAWWRKHHEHTDWREQVSLTLDDWCVVTPDAICTHDGEVVSVQAKTAADMDAYGEPGTDAIPVYYLTQVYLEMEVAHRNGIPVARTHVPILGGRRLLFSNYIVEYDASIGADLLDRMKAWAEALKADTPPPLDDSVATYDAVRKVHKDIERGESVELSVDQAYELVRWVRDAKTAERSARLHKSRVIDLMGRAQYATHNGVRIARRQPRGDDVTFVVVAKPEDLTPLEESA